MVEMKKEEKKVADHIAEIRKNFDDWTEYWAADRARWLEDAKFVWLLEQWNEADKSKRDKEERITVVVDKLGQHLRQVVNDARMNRPGIVVSPVDSISDPETAEKISGLFRHTAVRSNVDAAYDTSIEQAIVGGFGFIRIHHDYLGENTDEQEVLVKRIPNPLSVTTSPHQEADGSDMKGVFVHESMDIESFKKAYPKADVSSWDTNGNDNNWWGSKEEVTVAEHWYIVEEETSLHRLSNGTNATEEQLQKLIDDGGQAPKVVSTRAVVLKKCMYLKTNGKEYLEGPKEWPSKYCPIVPVYGNECNIEGEFIHQGMFRPAKDAQRLYNYAASAFAERVALAPDSPYVAAVGQVEDFVSDWDGSTRVAVKRYTPQNIDGKVAPPPRRDQPPDIPTSIAVLLEHCEHDIQAALGQYAASLGKRGNATSGKQELAQQREGDVGTFHYHDNQARAIKHVWKVVLDMLPKIMDTKRIQRILGEDGKEEVVTFDPAIKVALKKRKNNTIYNLGVGRYDVVISVGPSYTTQRQQAQDFLSEATKANSNLWVTHADLIFKAQDGPMAEEMAKRSTLLMPPEIKQAIDKGSGEEDGQGNKQIEIITQQAQAAIQERDQVIQGLQQAVKEMQGQLEAKQGVEGLKAQNEALKLSIEKRKADIQAYEAETKRMVEQSKAQDIMREKDQSAKIAELAQHLDQLTEAVAALAGINQVMILSDEQ